MKATDEWVFLCAAHETPKQCSAIDYICHTLNGANALVNSTKIFPSRVHFNDKALLSYMKSMVRRLYRIFAHIFYHHRQTFDEIEERKMLCSRFTQLVLDFALMPQSMLIVKS